MSLLLRGLGPARPALRLGGNRSPNSSACFSSSSNSDGEKTDTPTLVTINTVINSVLHSLNTDPTLSPPASSTPYTALDTMVTPSTNADFGDYQVNAAMKLAKSLKMKPRDVAASLVASLCLHPSIASSFETPEIAGPGFINLTLKPSTLSTSLTSMASSPTLAVPSSPSPLKTVVDFSSPNIAKEMHVGHLRSTIIGDSLSNVLTFLGHDVVRLNHVGDWGTQFGMLVEHLNDSGASAETADVGDLVEFYKAAKRRFDSDPDFKTRSRETVVRLQRGDADEIAKWKSLCEASRGEYGKIYERLGIEGLEERGESFYNSMLPGVVSDLEDSGLAEISDGATCVFLDGWKNKEGDRLPLLVRKTDGGYNYATTDLAAVRQRVEVERAERVL